MAVSRTVKRTPEWREMLKRSLLRSGALIGAIMLMLATLFLALALLSYAPSDPSMNTVAGDQVANIMQSPGAWVADFLLWLLGVPVALILPLMAVTARRLWGDHDMAGWKGQFGQCLLGIVLVGIALALFQSEPLVGLPAGWGGVIGLVSARGIDGAGAGRCALDQGRAGRHDADRGGAGLLSQSGAGKADPVLAPPDPAPAQPAAPHAWPCGQRAGG